MRDTKVITPTRDSVQEGRRGAARRIEVGAKREGDPVADLPNIPLTPIPVTGRTGPRPGY